jgi:hypothetical protein
MSIPSADSEDDKRPAFCRKNRFNGESEAAVTLAIGFPKNRENPKIE